MRTMSYLRRHNAQRENTNSVPMPPSPKGVIATLAIDRRTLNVQPVRAVTEETQRTEAFSVRRRTEGRISLVSLDRRW
jgi:hypothetical protein